MIVNEQELISSKDDDIFLYENKENKPNQSKKSKKKNDLINNLKKNLVDVKDSENYRKKREKISWMKCLRKITPIERSNYCKSEFNSLSELQKKCEVFYIFYNKANFCNVCCKNTVPWVHKNYLYTCKKQCKELTKAQPEFNRGAINNYEKLCIKVENPKTSIYSYCDENFSKNEDKQICKLDSCRLCCVTSDKIQNINLGIGILNKCFKKCAKTWKI